MLIDKGADVNIPNETGSTPIFDAAIGDLVGVSKYWDDYSLLQESHMSYTKCLEILLNHGAEANTQRSNDGWTPLMQAIWKKHAE